ncbi:hypothetical protein K435DRAFT_586289, partial [Dendrothele bispora CBS 962.96]
LIDKLLQEIDERRVKIKRVTNILSPIRRLPPEMLTEIFTNYIEPNATSEVCTEEKDRVGLTSSARPLAKTSCNALPHPLLLSQVCIQWRNIIQSTPRLW